MDTFKGILQEKSDDEKYIGQQTQTVQNQLQDRAIHFQKRYVRFGKREVISREGATRLKTLFPNAAISLQNFWLKKSKVKDKLSVAQLQAELFVKDDGSEEEQLDNQNSFSTSVGKVPVNGNSYIALTSHASKQHICDWMGSILECYVLRSKSLNDPFENVDSQNVLEAVVDCDKNQEAQKT